MSQALKAAIEANDAAATAKAAAKVKDLSRKLPRSTTPVLLACELGADKSLEALLAAGAMVKGQDKYAGNHPFAVAEKKHQIAVMRVLADTEGIMTQEILDHVLFTAMIEGRRETVEFMLQRFKPRMRAALVDGAIWWKDGRMLKLLVDHGADVNTRNDGEKNHEMLGRTAMHGAAHGGHAEGIEMLARHGGDVNARDALGRTPLMLLAGGMSRLDQEKQSRDALAAEYQEKWAEMRASQNRSRTRGDRDDGDGIEAAKLLLKLGADVAATDQFGNDAIMYCQWESRRDRQDANPLFLALLEKHGANEDSATEELFWAIWADDVTAAEKAIEAGADVNRVAPPLVTSTPLLMSKSLAMVEVLLEAGADVNKPSLGNTPLIGAATSGELNIVKRLIAAGASIHAIQPRPPASEYLANAYSAARLNRKHDVAEYLKSLGAGEPVLPDWQPLKPGVGMWENFAELLIHAGAEAGAEALAKWMGDGAKVQTGVYGKTVSPGKCAFVVVQPVGMAWSNVLQITPSPKAFEDMKVIEKQAAAWAKAAGQDVLSIQYSDAAGAAGIFRVSPAGKTARDDGWDMDTLEEVVGEMGDEAPDDLKKKLAEMKKNGQEEDSGSRLEEMAEREKFVVASFGLSHEPGRKLSIEFAGLPAEAFAGLAFVSD